MQIIEAGIENLNSLLEKDKADVILEIEPMVSFAEEKGLKTVISLKDFYSDFLYTGVVVKQELIDSNKKELQAFVSGLQKGLSFCESSKESLLPIAKKLFPALSDNCLLSAINRMQKARCWPKQVLVDSKTWRNSLSLRYESGEVEKVVDELSFLDQSFAFKAVSGRH